MSAFLRDVMSFEEADRTLILVQDMTDIYTKKNYSRLNRLQRNQKEAIRLPRLKEILKLINMRV